MKRSKRIIGLILLVAIIIATIAVPTAMADTRGYDCPSCGTGSLYTYVTYGPWYGYHTTACIHGYEGLDKLFWRWEYTYDKCNNCGAQFLISQQQGFKRECLAD